MKTQTIKCHFKNSRGHVLDARLDISANIDSNNIKSFIIFCHCFTCTKETITTFRLSRLLAEEGYGVLRFDFTGLGNSEGDFSSSTFSTTQDDLKSAIEFLNKNYKAPTFLMGHSLGGTTALSIAQDYDSIKGVVTVASPSDPEHVLHHFGHALTLLEQGMSASFKVAGQHYDIEPAFVEDVRKTNMQSVLSELEKPVLVFNIENDALVDENNAEEIQQWVKGETELVTLKNTDHLLSDKQINTSVAQQIIDWLQKI
ncbi:Bll2902 protein [hydrothermal vent metagenome]|uniref:Bll2902 protein n=1 Tax=hydrothermal vent metagenome TaxID=652676 RepID=A0A3B0X1F5_9ZZZZ